jgi:hypothetical protein
MNARLRRSCTLFSICILAFFLFTDCTSQVSELPEQFRNLENLSIHSANEEPEVAVSFQEEAVYGLSDEIFIGMIQDIAIGLSGRVFIADIQNRSIYVFEPEGKFTTQLGRGGKGPGEFGIIKSLQIRGDILYVFEPDRNQVSLFELDSLAFKRMTLLAGNRGEFGELDKSAPWIRDLLIRSGQTYLAGFNIYPNPTEYKLWQNVDSKILFYLLDDAGKISSKKLFDVFSPHTFTGPLVVNINVFFGSPIVVVSSQNKIYVSDASEFLIKVYHADGVYEHAFYYPNPNIPLTRESIENGGIMNTHFRPEFLLEHLESMELPRYWPVINDMIMDDENRLWIATTVGDMSIFEWWVVEETGELITKFEWPRNEQIKVVKNGYMYTRKTEEETGLQTIVKYQVEMNEKLE